MCGIAGIWHRDGRPVQRSALERANQLLAHRGPDGEGIRLEGSIGFAHRRLAIVDLSSRAAQPLLSPDGRFWLLFNGEIHNYLELKSELELLGEEFRSESDAEVVLTAFRRWGTSCFSRFNGMWAVAIWDQGNRELVLSRDRFGIKPLYYSSRGPRFTFASEVKAILANFPEEEVMDEGEAFSYLVGGNPDGDSRTFFANVMSLPQASFLVVAGDSALEPVDYWRLDPGLRSGSDAAEQFRFLLDDSVRLRMRSDVPVGICLSGGLDSSSVARLAVNRNPEPLHCFSLRYDDHPGIDESAFVRLVADDPERYRVHWVTPRGEDVLSNLRRIVWHHDAPVPLRGRIAFWAVMDETSRWVKVAMVGEGGDELLAGYGRFVLPFLLDRWRRDGWRGCVAPRRIGELKRLLEGTNPSLPRAFLNLAYPLVRRFRLYPAKGPGRVIDPQFARERRNPDAHKFHHTWLRSDVERPFESHLNNALWIDFRHSGLPELLHQQDAIGMAFSVECRPPMLDHRLVEFCFSLNFDEKIRSGWSKHLLRRAMINDLPEPVLRRRDKKGMPTPFAAFLTAPDILRELGGLVLEGELVSSGVLQRRPVRRLMAQLQSNLIPLSSERLGALWRCVTLELWYRQFLGGERPGV